MFSENLGNQVPQSNTIYRNFLRNPENEVPMPETTNKYNNKQESEFWLSVEEVRNLLNISDRAVRKAIQSTGIKGGKYEKLVARKTNGSYEILLTSLSENIQQKYMKEIVSKYTSPSASDINNNEQDQGEHSLSSANPFELTEEEKKLYLNLIETNRKKIDKYISLFRTVHELGIMGKRAKIETFLKEVWNKKHPKLSCAYKTYNTNLRLWQKHGIRGIAGNWGNNKGNSIVKERWFADFAEAYLKIGAPTIKSCWIIAMGAAMKRNEIESAKQFPSRDSFKKRVDKMIPSQAQYFARHGEHNWNKKHGAYIARDDSNLKCNEMWVGDHGQVDIMVEFEDGKPGRPWVTVWADQKSGKWLGYDIHEEAPNSDHIFISSKRGMKKYGVPGHWYMDNGKDYRCYDFAGGRTYHKVSVDTVKTTSLISMTGSIAHYAIPRNAQAKFVERTFREHRDWFDKHMPAYTGNRPDDC